MFEDYICDLAYYLFCNIYPYKSYIYRLCKWFKKFKKNDIL